MPLPDIKLPAGFDDAALHQLAAGLNPQQLVWLSGYFYGRATTGETGTATPAAAPAPATAVASAAPRLIILYGSQTGNAKKVANQTAEAARQRGLTDVVVQDMNDYATRTLATEKLLLVIVSTQGEGDPPLAAEDVRKFLLGNRAPKLPELRYAVLALGDRSYLHFCQTGREFDERLAELGAQRLLNRVDCDLDFHEPARQWQEEVLTLLAAEVAAKPPTVTVGATAAAAVPGVTAAPTHSRQNPFSARVLEKIKLNGRGSDKETYHLELSLAESGLHYVPGDSLAVLPTNSAALVGEVLRAAHLGPDEAVQINGTQYALTVALTEQRELSVLTRDMLERYATLAPQHGKLRELLTDLPQLQHYLYGRDVADLLTEFPAELAAQQLVEVLRQLPARSYSLASSLLTHPDEAHLTVGAVRYEAHGRRKHGVCSSHLADGVEIDDVARVFVEHNEYFKLPTEPATDIIMVGAGTGVAPFRAFVEERVELGASGRNWLLFGNPHFTTDFLYQTEWQQHLKKGGLAKLDVAFSRDQAEKVYVQNRLLENARDVYGWLENGASFYVCGDKKRLGEALQTALTQVVQQQAGLSLEAATDYVRSLKKQRRYLEDVY